MGWGKAFYLKQLGFLATNDIDGLLREHYHEDAVMITFDAQGLPLVETTSIGPTWLRQRGER